MPVASEMQDLEKTVEELCCLAIREQQLENRRAILSKQQEFRNKHTMNEENEGPSELSRINQELELLSKKKEELVTCKEQILLKRQEPGAALTKIKSKDDCIPTYMNQGGLAFTKENLTKISPPPLMPAPRVFLDVENLPPCPSKTRCPSCQEFITTETFPSVGNIAWLLCFLSVILGCVAGCCLIPFCVDNAKDIVHRCPKCQKKIHTTKKL